MGVAKTVDVVVTVKLTRELAGRIRFCKISMLSSSTLAIEMHNS